MKKLMILFLTIVFTIGLNQKAKAATLQEVLDCGSQNQVLKDQVSSWGAFYNYMNQLGIPLNNGNGDGINKHTVLNYSIVSYGPQFDGPGDSPKYIGGVREYRNLGYGLDGTTHISNPHYPNDVGITSDYTRVQYFQVTPWNVPTKINRGRKPPVRYGDPRWNNSSQINPLDSYRLEQLGRAVDLPYIESVGNYNEPQKYLLTNNVNGGPYIQSGLGNSLTYYANVEEYPTTYLTGVFDLYHPDASGTMFYHSYLIPAYEPLFPRRENLYIGDSITNNPINPLPNDNVSVTVSFYNNSESNTPYYNIPVQFGWAGDTLWCSTVPSMPAHQWTTITFNSSYTTKCDGTTSTFKYPMDGGNQTFFAYINYNHTAPTNEINWVDNFKNYDVIGAVPTETDVNCASGSRYCIVHYPKFPSTRTEGGSGEYYKLDYTYKVQQAGTTYYKPYQVIYDYTLTDPQNNTISSGSITRDIPANCYVGHTIKNSCRTNTLYIGNNYINTIMPISTQKVPFYNVGKYKLLLKITEKRTTSWDRTTCDGSSCSTENNVVADAGDLVINAEDDVYATGISSGIGNQ